MNNMKTKEEIVGQLLTDKKITGEEAIIILQGQERQTFNDFPVINPFPFPYRPTSPYEQTPIWIVDPASQPTYTATVN